MEVEVVSLPVGDYYVPGKENSKGVIVERKTMTDLVNAIKEGRLMNQMVRLKESGERAVLLLEGSFYEVEKFTKFPLNALVAAMRAIAVSWEIPVVGPLRKSLVAYFLENLARSVKGKKKVFALRPSPPREWSLERKALYILEGFPGIGPLKAREVVEHFGSLRDFVNASAEEIASIPGIGMKTAEEIYRVVNFKFKERGD
ncbi:MAG: hypothetical protein DRJ03_22930 [Chloroflexi bacterium]|nr:MAG: hypothetical protein DRJ03_22930 [Chloroflexota bacterium]